MDLQTLLMYGGGTALVIFMLGKFLISKMKKTMMALQPGEKTPPGELCMRVLDELVEKLGPLEEIKTSGHKTWMDMYVKDFFNKTIMGENQVGEVRLWVGPKISKMVYCRMTVNWMGMDSHMIFVFTKNGSCVPHFTIDSVRAPKGVNAFHLDLISRVDLGANLAYMDHFYSPLDETATKIMAMKGRSKANLSLRQIAIMSPWMGFGRLATSSYGEFGGYVDVYLKHWLERFEESSIPAEVAAEVADCDLAMRSRKNRSLIFNRDVDKVWGQVDRVVGADVSEKIRLLCADPDRGVPAKYLK